MKKSILIMGPTATGKTKLSIELSKYYPIEIVSVDSALIYKDMNIGTSKPTEEELKLVKHHLIDIVSPLESYSLANFINDSSVLIDDINNRGKIPVLVGGTMMYFNSFINGISKLPLSNLKIREDINNRIIKDGLDVVYDELKQVDYLSSIKINENDIQRIIRALEVYYLTGVSISKLQLDNKIIPAQNLNLLIFAICPQDRGALHERINTRFHNMLQGGLVDEMKFLLNKYPDLSVVNTSMRSVGYLQTLNFLNDVIDYNELLFTGMAATRQLAKRQMTWLKKITTNNNLIVIDSLDLTFILNKLIKEIEIWHQ